MAITADKLFISEEMFKSWSQINGAVDWTFITPHVITVQDTYLQRYLGTALFEKLKTDFNSWSGNYTTLVDTYVRKVVLWWTVREALPNLRVKINNGALTIYQGEDFQAATEQDMKRLVDQATKNAQHYTAMMVDYLCYNSSLFPEYTTNTGIQRPPSTRVYRGFDIDIMDGRRDHGYIHAQDWNPIYVWR